MSYSVVQILQDIHAIVPVGKKFIWWLLTIFSLHLSGSSIFLDQQIAQTPACAPNIFIFGFKIQDGSKKDFDIESRNKSHVIPLYYSVWVQLTSAEFSTDSDCFTSKNDNLHNYYWEGTSLSTYS